MREVWLTEVLYHGNEVKDMTMHLCRQMQVFLASHWKLASGRWHIEAQVLSPKTNSILLSLKYAFWLSLAIMVLMSIVWSIKCLHKIKLLFFNLLYSCTSFAHEKSNGCQLVIKWKPNASHLMHMTLTSPWGRTSGQPGEHVEEKQDGGLVSLTLGMGNLVMLFYFQRKGVGKFKTL